MEKNFSTMLGVGLALLMSAGFVKSEKPKHLLGLMNVDTQHSILRIPTTLALLYAGSRNTSLKNTRMILSRAGMLYLLIGTIGSVDKKAGGALPSKLTNFDLVYHFVVGASALWLGMRSGRMMKD
jgi:hypothetical protein